MEQINATLVLNKLSTTLVDDSKKETTVSGIVCRLANLKTTVSVTPDLAGLFMPDSQCEAQGQHCYMLHVRLVLCRKGTALV